MADVLTVDCPTCARRTEYSPRNPWRPFCSERCRGVDLGAWASEQFRVPSQTDPGEADDESPGPGAPPSAQRG